MNKIIIILITVGLTACSNGGSGGGGGNTPTTPTGTSKITYSENGHFYGIIPLNTPKETTISLTNTGTKTSGTLTFSGLPGSFVISNNTCSGKQLAVNETCSLKITITMINSSAVTTGNLNVSEGGTKIDTLSFAGKSITASQIDNILVSSLVLPLLVAQNVPDGSWNESTAFDMGMTVYSLKTVAESKNKALYSQEVFSGAVGLDYTLDYFQRVDDDGAGSNPERDIDFSADLGLVIPQWTRPNPAGGMKLKEMMSVAPIFVEEATQVKSSAHANIYSSIDNFLDSRRMSSGTSSMMAQYAYLMDENRWEDVYGSSYLSSNYNEVVELALKDVYLTLDGLIKAGKTTKAQELAKAILLNFLSTSDEIFDETGVRLQYSTVEFDHSSFTSADITEPLFSRVNTCRMNAYVLLLVSKSLKVANFTDLNVLFDNDNLKQDLEDNITNFFWPNFKSVWIDDPYSDNHDNCIPIAALAAKEAPRKAVSASQVATLYNQMFNAANNNDYDPSGAGSLLTTIEAIEAMTQSWDY